MTAEEGVAAQVKEEPQVVMTQVGIRHKRKMRHR